MNNVVPSGVAIMRGVERIIAIAAGSMAIYLGFLLFLAVPQQHESEGKITFSNSTSVYVNRVGPGVLFALFGGTVIVVGLWKGPSYVDTVTHYPGKKLVESSQYTGLAGAGAVSEEERPLIEAQLRADLSLLNVTIPNALDASTREQFLRRLPEIKLALLYQAWQPNWGSYEQFRQWVSQGGAGDPPESIEVPARYFSQGV